MMKMYPHKTGLVIAALLGGGHLLWVLLVAMNFAQTLADFIFHLHFIKPVYMIEPFNAATAVFLIAITTAIGYSIGWCFAILWNKLHP